MSLSLDTSHLDRAFEGRPDLQQAIRAAAVGDNYIELFNQISVYICGLSSISEPASKKRKLDERTTKGTLASTAVEKATTNGSSDSIATSSDPVLLEIKDISVVVPQRKKYTLCFTASHIYARPADSPEPISSITYAWKDIEYVFCLPVPEKSQKQHNFVVFSKSSSVPPSRRQANAPSLPEPLVFTIPDSAPKSDSISGPSSAAASSVSDDHKTLFSWALTSHLRSASNNVKITEADAKIFSSAVRQAHRPNEKAVHVKAFRGSKDGYLFLLPNGILWAFKKPLLFLPHDRIVGVAFTNVLQRTFNLSIEAIVSSLEGEEEGVEEHEDIEFAMLDQEDYAGIDAFIKKHGLRDKSMAEQRKAKMLGINAPKGENGETADDGVEGGKLEIAALEAEQVIQDAEDEDEEDYDPGSEGDSGGEGSSSEEDEDGANDEEVVEEDEEEEEDDGADEH